MNRVTKITVLKDGDVVDLDPRVLPLIRFDFERREVAVIQLIPVDE